MSQETELQRLEVIVEKLLVKYEDLRAENASLKQDLTEKNLRLAELEDNLSVQKNERGEIGKRVSKLVEQIEEWEKALDEDGSEQPAADAQDSLEAVEDEEEDPEPVEAEAEAEADVVAAVQEDAAETRKTVDEEGRHQHNLFSLSGFQR